jgi:peptide-methionine (S)-S-oxide reductase
MRAMRARAATAGTLLCGAAALAAAAWLGWLGLARAAEPAAETVVALPAPAVDDPKHGGRLETAVLAGGCFWGMQAVFEHVRGVRAVLAGYSGGRADTAHYTDVGTGTTGHAESVQITFDPGELSFGELLQIYFSVAHDPTELDRQGPDSGPQYRSDIFYSDDTQRRVAASYIAQLDQAHSFSRPIVTRVDPLKRFYPAEVYHQDFYLKNPSYPYIVVIDLPKIRYLQQLLPQYYVATPVTVRDR